MMKLYLIKQLPLLTLSYDALEVELAVDDQLIYQKNQGMLVFPLRQMLLNIS